MAKKSVLGKGLDDILSNNFSASDQPFDNSGITMLRLSKIEPNPEQPRREFDSELLSELADSIANHGLIQPIAVKPSKNDGYYTIVAGERRWRASKMAGLTNIPVIIMEIDDKKASEIALIENIQRKDLNPIEEARAYRSLIDEYNLTQAEVAAQVGKSRVAITNAMRILDLPDEVLDMISSGSLTTGHARALLGLKNPDDIEALAKRAADEELSVRVVEENVRRLNMVKREGKEKVLSPEDIQKKEYYKAVENKATKLLGNKIKITTSSKNKNVSISFSSNEELEDILTKLCGMTIFDDIR